MPEVVERFGKILATQFYDAQPDFVITVETKGIPIALATARALNCPCNGPEGKQGDRGLHHIHKLRISLLKAHSDHVPGQEGSREGQRGLIVDDFMKGGERPRG